MGRRQSEAVFHLFSVSTHCSVVPQWSLNGLLKIIISLFQLQFNAQHNLARAALVHNTDLLGLHDGPWKGHQNAYTMVMLRLYFHLWTTISHVQCGIIRMYIFHPSMHCDFYSPFYVLGSDNQKKTHDHIFHYQHIHIFTSIEYFLLNFADSG